MWTKAWWRYRKVKIRLMFLTALRVPYIGIFATLLYISIREALKEDPNTITLNLYVLALVFQLALTGYSLAKQRHLPWLLGEFAELRRDFAGTFILTGLLLFLVTIPAERKAEYQLKRQLIREMGSGDNPTALRAVDELRAQGWLQDGSLDNANLQVANLQRADLHNADLSGCLLIAADLRFAYLSRVILSEANLAQASLQYSSLNYANLTDANLEYTNLGGAVMMYANLVDTNLKNANLERTILTGVLWSEETILPDGTRWSPNIDITRFTDPDHPNFWRSDNPLSPAYQGDNSK